MVGASGVGKTSLVRQFVNGVFDEKYLTTIGVKVDERIVCLAERQIKLLVWDVAGAEERFSIPLSYIRGAAGCLLVVDVTRPDTIGCGLELWRDIQRELGDLPFVVTLNKIDLVEDVMLDEIVSSKLMKSKMPIVHSSAKTGEGVKEAFSTLAQALH